MEQIGYHGPTWEPSQHLEHCVQAKTSSEVEIYMIKTYNECFRGLT